MFDFTKCKTAEEAAKLMYEFVRKQCEAVGSNPDIETFIWSPEETLAKGYGSHWRVSWESGPLEWAIWLGGGNSMYHGEFEDELGLGNGPPEVNIWTADQQHWQFEHYYSFDFCFYNVGWRYFLGVDFLCG